MLLKPNHYSAITTVRKFEPYVFKRPEWQKEKGFRAEATLSETLINMPLYGFQQKRRSVVQPIIWLFSRPTKATSLIFGCG